MANNLITWIKRLRTGDQSAFLPLYEKTSPGLMRFLLWKTNGDRPMAEDILQEAYVRFLLHLDNVQSEKDIAVQSYLLHIVKNVLIDKVARTPQASRQHVSLDALAELNDPNQTSRPETAVELRELSVAMNTLNEKESEIIWMRDALGLSHREVASQTGMTEQASRQAYVRAKKNLISRLADRFLPQISEGGACAVSEMP